MIAFQFQLLLSLQKSRYDESQNEDLPLPPPPSLPPDETSSLVDVKGVKTPIEHKASLYM